MNDPVAAKLTESLAAAGFLCLGGFEPGPSDQVPALANGQSVNSLYLIGSTGPSLWPFLCRSPEYSDDEPDPLDRYTRRVLRNLATDLGYEVLFPFDGPPYHPFQRWALKCGGFSQSPLGVLAHTNYGPWAGFRAVFLSSGRTFDGTGTHSSGPCETCHDKPCISICPVDAITSSIGYDVPKCRDHLRMENHTKCWSGCLARRACPYGTDHQQDTETAYLHMKSFVDL
ncbi:MAG: hypothetical protein AAGA50_30805 [Pseudomonadota bacterium]